MGITQVRTTAELMRNKRNSINAIFKKFTEARRLFGKYGFCFYEGEDAKYYQPRIHSVFGDRIIQYTMGNKKSVIQIMGRITNDTLYNNVSVMFFVDRDFDPSVAGTHKDLFETPCYSIENLYAQESVFSRIIQAEFGLNLTDTDYAKCLELYRDRLKEFNEIIVAFNAIVKYQHQFAPETICNFSGICTSHLVCVTLDCVCKGRRHDEKIEDLISQLNIPTESMRQIMQELRAEEHPNLYFRGKNQLDFMVEIIKILKEQNRAQLFFTEKHTNVNITLSKNRLSELSQYAVTPTELEEFIHYHYSIISA